jgi:hypothetical protein
MVEENSAGSFLKFIVDGALLLNMLKTVSREETGNLVPQLQAKLEIGQPQKALLEQPLKISELKPEFITSDWSVDTSRIDSFLSSLQEGKPG